MKFKVGDKVKVANVKHALKKEYVGKEFTIKYINPNGEYTFNEPHYGVGAPFIFLESELIRAIDSKIVITTDGKITTAKLYENGKVVKTAEAKCYPEDTFDFNVGAKLAVERLTKVEETPKYYNGKVVCVSSENAYDHGFTVGKIYNIVDGLFIDNDGDKRPFVGGKVKTIDDLKSGYFKTWAFQFVPFVEN
jgi:hypothetical protein